MKKVSLNTATDKSLDYLMAILKFFEDIPEIIHISNVYFVKATNRNVYFHVGRILLEHYSCNFKANVCVRKSDFAVGFFDESAKIVVRNTYLDLFRTDRAKIEHLHYFLAP